MSHSLTIASTPWKLSVSLLKEFTVVLHTADGLSYPIPISPNTTRIQLLAYLAWQRGWVARKKIFDDVLRHGLAEEEATPRKLKDKFYAHVKLLKRDVQVTIARLNVERGTDPLPTNLDLFEHKKHGGWSLSSLWQVTDLEKVEASAKVVQEADHRSFYDPLSEQMRKTCAELIAAYPGDFLEEMLRVYPEEFRPIATSWVRKPFTLYRDYYLQALWYVAEYEWQRGQKDVDGRQWKHAAQCFQRYAMYACNSPLDTDVSFHTEKYRAGFRVLMSEDAVCRSLIAYKAIGKRQELEECKQAYIQQMEQISGGIWRPGEKLREIMQTVNQ